MKIIFSDFDGTLTNNGKIGAIFFDILSLIQKNNSELVIVSGRSLSWGHFFLTHFDFKHCIMEGGGVILNKDDEGHIHERDLVSLVQSKHLLDMTKKLLQDVPAVVLSKDSFGRRTDQAIEFSQMSTADIEKTIKFFETHKLNYSQSNVHINFWVGDISKANAVNTFMQSFLPGVSKDDVCFFGDAMNDESMFEFFPNTIGVSNISEILSNLISKPKIVLEGSENAGALGVYNYLKNNIFAGE